MIEETNTIEEMMKCYWDLATHSYMATGDYFSFPEPVNDLNQEQLRIYYDCKLAMINAVSGCKLPDHLDTIELRDRAFLILGGTAHRDIVLAKAYVYYSDQYTKQRKQ